MQTNILEIKNVFISFGGLSALEDVSMDVKKGEIHALIGPNGAGKTTVFNCISRFYSPDRGDILFKGHSIMGYPAHKIANIGIGRTFQNIELFEQMTVIDNILLGYHLYARSNLFQSMLFIKKIREREIKIRRAAEDIIDFLDLQPYRVSLVGNIPYGVQKRVELARALAIRPEFILLDEPAAGLNKEETEDLYWYLLDIKEELKITILIIEHDMGFIMRLADNITVLNYGVIIARGKPEEIQDHPEVLTAYMGSEANAKG